ncbi:hypothetical protein [Streptomyces lycii]|uniref:Uncharacterized protein n=1 Tax=Streptomyces lycii TaxID=2654337 RepID=A0ABQ7FN11_9ACTN|nr:hypothetical protein [Streptomyces lycii]KAF4408638.1 hypothetical protein GCU69_13140 [Streptomyces lycii]
MIRSEFGKVFTVSGAGRDVTLDWEDPDVPRLSSDAILSPAAARELALALNLAADQVDPRPLVVLGDPATPKEAAHYLDCDGDTWERQADGMLKLIASNDPDTEIGLVRSEEWVRGSYSPLTPLVEAAPPLADALLRLGVRLEDAADGEAWDVRRALDLVRNCVDGLASELKRKES